MYLLSSLFFSFFSLSLSPLSYPTLSTYILCCVLSSHICEQLRKGVHHTDIIPLQHTYPRHTQHSSRHTQHHAASARSITHAARTHATRTHARTHATRTHARTHAARTHARSTHAARTQHAHEGCVITNPSHTYHLSYPFLA